MDRHTDFMMLRQTDEWLDHLRSLNRKAAPTAAT